MIRAGCTALLFLLVFTGCRDRGEHADHKDGEPKAEAPRAPIPDPTLERDRDDYIADAMAFTGTTREQVVAKITTGAVLKDEWNTWEKAGPMTDARTKEFYKQTMNYIYDLAAWHLYDNYKRQSDLALVEDMRAAKPKNILDFGGGVGFNALLLAQAGFDVTLADLDSATLRFAALRAERRNVKLKLWKSDVEDMPPDKKYDVIICLDVLEHLPQAELHTVVDKLIKLKHAGTKILLNAPFGRTDAHPMHLDSSKETLRQVKRLRNELPDD
jgi:protein-L-isoaspartate O-methyltransferase